MKNITQSTDVGKQYGLQIPGLIRNMCSFPTELSIYDLNPGSSFNKDYAIVPSPISCNYRKFSKAKLTLIGDLS